MKKLTALFAGLLFTLSFSNAQDKPASPWEIGGQGILTYNQVGLVNWAAGGNSNMTLIGNLGLFANRKNAAATSTWENSLDLAYGFLKNYRNNAIFTAQDNFITKAEDKIDFNSKYGQKAWSEKFAYAALLNFRTQFAPGYGTPADQLNKNYISRALAPGYLILALGLDFKPFKSGDSDGPLSLFLSPVSGKVTLVMDDSLAAISAFGVNQKDENGDLRPGSFAKSRMEFGATFRAKYKQDFSDKRLGVESMLELFSNYIDRPGNIDVKWDNALVAKVNKFIAVTFFTNLIYDNDIMISIVDNEGNPVFGETNGVPNSYQKRGPRIQFKEVFGVGFTYKFNNKSK